MTMAEPFSFSYLGKWSWDEFLSTPVVTAPPTQRRAPKPTPAPSRYEFTETGVGCAEHADPACLCDVDLTQYPVTPLRYPPASVMYSRLAGEMCMGEFDKITWEGWAGWLCAITDEAARIKVSALVSIVAECKAETENGRFSGDTRSVLRRAYPTLLAAGYDTEHCANILATTPQALYELLCANGKKLVALGLDGFLLLEFMLKDGSLSTAEMMKECETSRAVVVAHAQRMNVTPPLGTKGKSQQPHVRACMEKCIADGLSLRKTVAKVLEETGVKVSEMHVSRHKAAQ